MSKVDHIIIFLFVAISGNPFVCQWSWASASLLAVFLVYIMLSGKIGFVWKGIKITKRYLLAFCTLFLFQVLFCADISIITQINYLIKILLAGLLYIYYDSHFKYLYLNVLTFIAIVSLIFYPFVMLGGEIGNPFGTGFSTNNGLHTLIIYNYNSEFNPDRNSGMFWEPGCFACYLCLVPVLFINKPSELIKNFRIKSLILFLALLSTRSTTGFLVLGVIMLFVFIKSWKSAAMVLVLGCLLLYPLSDVITEKLNRDTETIDRMTLGEYVSYDGYNTENRLGTIFFLAPLIMLHPIVGNGLNPEAMFSSMKEILALEHIGLGNGFFTYWASLGLLGIFFYFAGILFYWKIPLRHRWISILIIVLLLQGEPLLIYPVVMGLPFLRH